MAEFSGVASPKIVLWWKMFWVFQNVCFEVATVFLLGTPLLKAQND